MAVEVANPFDDIASGGMENDVAVFGQQEFHIPVMIPGKKVNWGVFRQPSEESRDFVTFLPGNPGDIVFDISQQDDTVGPGLPDAVFYPFQPFFKAAGNQETAAVEVPFDAYVDVGHDKGPAFGFHHKGGFTGHGGSGNRHYFPGLL
jgi:hypothetical protein